MPDEARQRPAAPPEQVPAHATEHRIPFALQRIDHVVLRVRDLDATVAFYERAFGCQEVRRRDDLGLVHLRCGASMIDLISVGGRLGRMGGAAPGAEGHNQDHLCLRIDPFDEAAIVDHLRRIGAAPRGTALRLRRRSRGQRDRVEGALARCGQPGDRPARRLSPMSATMRARTP